MSVNPYTNLDIYGSEYVNQYKGKVFAHADSNMSRQLGNIPYQLNNYESREKYCFEVSVCTWTLINMTPD